jgi:glycosyltransferase involved in cell wall biosynthesis
MLKNHLENAWGIPPEKIIVLPNGANPDRFHPEINNIVYRTNLGLPDSPIILFIGGFYPWQAVKQLIDEFVIVLNEIPTACLYLIGDGPSRSQLIEYVNEHQFTSNIKFIGPVAHTAIPTWLGACDVAVAPFKPFVPGYGGSPLKLFEYMAAGKAIVATATGQVTEIIRNGENGLLVPPYETNGFSKAILLLLNNPRMRKQMGLNARNDLEMKYSWSGYAEKLIDIYHQFDHF